MPGKTKSEMAELDKQFADSNRKAIDAAVEAVRHRYFHQYSVSVNDRMAKEGYDAAAYDLCVLRDIKTLIDVVAMYSADRHHFEKYHAADSDAFDRGEHYLGTQCVSCEYSRSQQRAVEEMKK